ncbi:MAG: EAL domain-containing protein [Sulfurimonas sp.]|jgi:diguanylate cyclase (GGDEF)-like protein/PAS domain S-box-containing protein
MTETNVEYEELTSIAYERLKLSSFAVIVNATILSLFLYGHVDSKLLLFWYFFILTVSLLRFASSIYYQRNREIYNNKKWKQIFYTMLLISSLLIAVTPFFFFVNDSYQHQSILMIIIAGLTAGAISSLSSLLRAVQLFLLLALIPLMIQLFFQNTFMHSSLALLVLFYLLLLLSIAKQFNENLIDILKSRQMYEEKSEELARSQERFETVFKQAPLGIMIYDTDLIIREVNQEFINFLEAPREYLIGLNLHTLPDERLLASLKAPLDNAEGFYEGEYTTKLKRKDLWITMSTSPLMDSTLNVIGGISIVADITQRMLTQLRFEHQASYDMLTDIPNRTTLLERVNQEIIRYKRHGVIFGIMFLDLDNFKNINDSLGHDVGDKLLIAAALRLKKAIRAEDTVARIGGDEFVVLIPDLGENEKLSATEAEYIAEKIHAVLAESFEIEGHKLNITSSIGIAFITSADESADDILKYADIAMYQAKKAGRDTTRFYKQKMDEWIKRRLGLENGLRDAIKNGELEIHYQPIIEFSTSKLIGAEALLRWNSEIFGSVYPDEFIAIAEESGLIISIGEWVLQNAINQFVLWQNRFKDVQLKKIAVNISVHQFDNPEFLNQVDRVLQNSGIKPQNLELELVESIIVKDVETVREKMQELRDLGVGISIDDFGTGYSSLSYLKKLPFTTLKIDKSFVQDIQFDADDKELISTILTIAKNFNLDVVAEGVETAEQYQFLSEKMCGYMQGFYCSKPMNALSFTNLLASSAGVCEMVSNQS